MNKIKKGDNVTVIAGKDKDKQGRVLEVIPAKEGNKVIVEGVNITTIHKKARTQNEKSQIVKVEKAIDASNVMVNCPDCNRPVRVRFEMVDDKKVRKCVKCGAVIVDNNKYEKKNKKEAVKKTTRKTRAKKAEKEETSEEVKEVKKTRTRKTAVKKEAEDK